MTAAYVNAPGVNPAVDAAGTEGINPTNQKIEGVTSMLTRLTAHHSITDTVVDLGTWPDAETTEAALADHAVDLQEDHGPVIRTWPGIGAGVTNVTYKDGHAIYFRETRVDDGPVDVPPPTWHNGPRPAWDSTCATTGDQIRGWARPFNDYTPELGDSRGLVDLLREDRLTLDGIVPGVETIQLAANYFDDQSRGAIHLTAAEARRVAQDLLAAADVFDNPPRQYRRDHDAIQAAADVRENLQ